MEGEFESCEKCGSKDGLVPVLLKNIDADVRVCGQCSEILPHEVIPEEFPDYVDENDEYKCEICGKLYLTVSELKVHRESHVAEKLCTSVVSIQQKNATSIKDEGQICDVCGIAFQCQSELKQHMNIHYAEKPYKCDWCETGFNHSKSLRRHKKNFHNGDKKVHKEDKSFVCKVCGKCFPDSDALKRHKYTHRNRAGRVRKKLHKCNVCGKDFCQRCELQEHMNVHTGEKPFICEQCGKRYPISRSLKKHKLVHSEKRHTCEDCGKTFLHTSHFRRHKRIIHDREKPFLCSECGQTCSQSSDLARHMTIHSTHKPFECKECGKTFRTKQRLSAHAKVHSKKVGKDLTTQDTSESISEVTEVRFLEEVLEVGSDFVIQIGI